MSEKFEIQQLNKENELNTVFQLYLSEGKYIRGLSDQTLENYERIFELLRKILPELKRIENLDPQILPEFFRRLGTRERKVGKRTVIGVKPSTVSTYYNKLMTFFRWLEHKKYIPDGYISNSVGRPPSPVYNDKRALSNTEVSKIIASVSRNTVDDVFLFKRDIAIAYTLLYTGVRRGELLGLRVQDIDFHQRLIFINGFTSKSKSNRYIPIHPTLHFHLKNYIKELSRRKYSCHSLFVSSKSDNGLSRDGLRHWVKRYKELSGVSFHLHRFRHTFACNLSLNGANLITIMKLLGHTTPRMTERYTRSIESKDSRSYIEKLGF